jgi:hypothetical protein
MAMDINRSVRRVCARLTLDLVLWLTAIEGFKRFSIAF